MPNPGRGGAPIREEKSPGEQNRENLRNMVRLGNNHRGGKIRKIENMGGLIGGKGFRLTIYSDEGETVLVDRVEGLVIIGEGGKFGNPPLHTTRPT
jgi:hypothetical protein